MDSKYRQGGFTLPGEAGYEQLTLELARKWGADVIRDSDGTRLSDDIISAGYSIYSTICIIRQHNAFASEHPDSQQQTFLCSNPVVATGDTLVIDPMEGYFTEQFELNDSPDAMPYWQVYDRTANTELPRSQWTYEGGKVTLTGCAPWHEYTVSFLCWRIWEEINMYNHTTNSWTSEHLRQLDPRHPAAWAYLQKWLENWCVENPSTNVVRLTSLFYNFVWLFGADMRNRSLFVDWASYDFIVSPAAMRAFEEQYGYALTAEDFINQRKLQATHMPPTKAKRDYMAFIQKFVAEKAKVLVDIIHKHGKKAYVFYDDSWVGMEPYGPYFSKVGFDGLIKCVFSGYECRLCANVDVPTHEIRFHPYLFPVGLGGLPTFSEGGNPAHDALIYWRSVRRALLRQCVDRIGLGGYLHLTIGFPEFNDAIENMAIEFRRIRELHANGKKPLTAKCRVAVVHTWGSLRSWTLSGHFHETDRHALIHINEALSGLPLDVKYLSFEDVENGALRDVDVVINAGSAGDAWSGGEAWQSEKLVAELTRFVYEGGAFIGVKEPSAVGDHHTYFRMAHVLGVDKDTGARCCHGRWQFDVEDAPFALCADVLGSDKNTFLTDGRAQVLCEKNGAPQMTINRFGKGTGVYMSDFTLTQESTRMLLELLLYLTGVKPQDICLSNCAAVETAYYPDDNVLAVLNNSEASVETFIHMPDGDLPVTLEPLETRLIQL
ncbi:MAG: 1,3-beta-galactosyl-N-acetylhexosamine phosphorylase [Clostridia bacterium]|nr:1,3-beta-galactosyl-N-acetylhexosamine phosphorylase [Clostridia bacterium]